MAENTRSLQELKKFEEGMMAKVQKLILKNNKVIN